MSNEDWIKLEDGRLRCGMMIVCHICSEQIPCQFSTSDNIFRIHPCECCREKKEKRPDFCKLREGDLLIIDYKSEKQHLGYFYKFHCREAFEVHSTNDYEWSFNVETSEVKKITRINLETQTFEEI